ncbi:glycogen synthase GlgA [Microvirga lotononidis]|uniref:Glycogen synthase n=1 Tax=Microvirga lotononidis TaxID=864069 RepID=I4YVZ8_9HYPH|nr:glycogen synthase GlgA [Microvirga lotononidis]EIM28140.1 glycogen/starch synthase, ADP-glucose type [Microvirga lotononidis]WQO27755.1 glycogen synthase GlgA [Microvirga lotononidis]
MRPLNVLSVASEVFPIIKTGGLADVAGALPSALAEEGVTVVTLMPGYPAVLNALENAETLHQYPAFFGGTARLLSGRAGGLDLFVIDAPHLFERPGSPYLAPNGRDWPDNARRFAALGRAAADIGQGLVPGFIPDIVHAHDWQAALVPVYLSLTGQPRPGTVVTIHNIAFQGIFPADLLFELGLPASIFTVDGVEYYGQIGFLKGGLQLADRITTVSPTYAKEIQTPEGGMALDGLLRARSGIVSGILNGIDDKVWDPATDQHLALTYDRGSLERRAANKRALQDRLGLKPDPDALLFGVVSRLSEQKGLDLVLAGLSRLLSEGAQLALLGAGDRTLEESFQTARVVYPGQVGCVIGYDEKLAHQIQGGSDALLVPSRFEPCGLTQLCAMRYGSIPVVSRVGGLADTIIDANEMAIANGAATGFQFGPVTFGAALDAIDRVKHLWRDKDAWHRLQANGMGADLSWHRPARQYADLYRSLRAV